MTTVHRFTSLAVNPAKVHTARAEDRDFIVLPVVMLVGDAVVRPLNSSGPEFVPMSELAVAPGQWAGRPIVADHPDGGTGSANDPKVLEANRYGWLYYPSMQKGKLCGEAWLDPQRAAAIGGDAERVVEVARRAMAGEAVDPVEVSVGCWVMLIRENGVSPSGVPYEYRWAGIASDHLAVGLNGSPGACDIEMGCGAPRAAKQSQEVTDGKATDQATAGSGEARTTPATAAEAPRVLLRAAAQERRMNLMQRVLAGLGFRQAAEDEGQSNMDLEGALWAAIYAAEPAVQWISDVFQESKTFIYATAPSADALMWWRRSYSVAEDGAVTLADDSEQVEPVTRYEPLAAATDDKPHLGITSLPKDTPGLIPGVGVLKRVGEPHFDHPAVARAACGCQGKGDGQAAAPNQGAEMNQKVTDLVGRLIANARSPYTDTHKAHLEALSEDTLTALDAAFQEPELEPKPEPAAAEPAKEPDPDDSERISKEELADLRAAASAHKRQLAAQKAALIAKLKGAQDAYSEVELQAMTVEQLERIAKLAKVDIAPAERDFTGKGFPAISDSADQDFSPPDTYGLVAAQRAKTATKEVN